MTWENVSSLTYDQARFLVRAMAFCYSDGGPYDADLVWRLFRLYPVLDVEFNCIPAQEYVTGEMA